MALPTVFIIPSLSRSPLGFSYLGGHHLHSLFGYVLSRVAPPFSLPSMLLLESTAAHSAKGQRTERHCNSAHTLWLPWQVYTDHSGCRCRACAPWSLISGPKNSSRHVGPSSLCRAATHCREREKRCSRMYHAHSRSSHEATARSTASMKHAFLQANPSLRPIPPLRSAPCSLVQRAAVLG